MKRTSSLESDGWSWKAPETLSYKGSIRILLDVYRLKVMRTQDREKEMNERGRERECSFREREERLLAVCRERKRSRGVASLNTLVPSDREKEKSKRNPERWERSRSG